ncbi:hypothetical protein ABZ464_20600 [Streptomyces sp. NPDC005820]|uniref:hypothetical protein n=1 Tax=Streptomyces sp. NPDC005820 TaxID=3157069 RepID=UPI0033EC4312
MPGTSPRAPTGYGSGSTRRTRGRRRLRPRSGGAPKARVHVVGHPAVLPPHTAGCGAETGLTAGCVDTHTPSVGRDACAGRRVRRVEPLVPPAPAAAVHPDERGEQGMADAVLERLGV